MDLALRWRWFVYGLLAYLPFAGIPILLAYPSGWPALIKDMVFVIPAYVAFGFALILGRVTLPPLRLTFILGIALTVLVAIQSLNPAVGNILVTLVGVKVWLFYLPLYVLGYNLIESTHQLSRLLLLLCAAGALPIVLGVIEAILLGLGNLEAVYNLYGPAAASATQHFVGFTIGTHFFLRRVPSTFSFVTQYYFFTTAMVAFAYGLWRIQVVRWTQWLAFGLFVLCLAASLSSGERGALLFIPLLVWVIALLEGRLSYALVGSALVLAVAALATVPKLLKGGPNPFTVALDAGTRLFRETFIDGLAFAAKLTWSGFGTGVATEASRHVSGHLTRFAALSGGPTESWYIKAWIELGILGPLLLIAIFLAIAVPAMASLRAHARGSLRIVEAALLGLVIWNFAYAMKAHPIDLDPMNVYFWLFAGVLARLPSFELGSPDGRKAMPHRFALARSSTQSLRENPPKRRGSSWRALAGRI